MVAVPQGRIAAALPVNQQMYPVLVKIGLAGPIDANERSAIGH